ncbi:hypothetical protein K4L44_09600 [Halosquirtibacter laminarini]|uniref:Uncharacterized protein n=1 Tax=Halosquirtibacter laminarini TaxID=3374600 RepID=A0AC61NHQ0_9BACT|nr:hypothetical protein K4L44_09600 [Prolixibacteraceae bacterium]
MNESIDFRRILNLFKLEWSLNRRNYITTFIYIPFCYLAIYPMSILQEGTFDFGLLFCFFLIGSVSLSIKITRESCRFLSDDKNPTGLLALPVSTTERWIHLCGRVFIWIFIINPLVFYLVLHAYSLCGIDPSHEIVMQLDDHYFHYYGLYPLAVLMVSFAIHVKTLLAVLLFKKRALLKMFFIRFTMLLFFILYLVGSLDYDFSYYVQKIFHVEVVSEALLYNLKIALLVCLFVMNSFLYIPIWYLIKEREAL